jgi:transcriptional regulator with XRE-family HTH domain
VKELKRLREIAGISQTLLAKKSGIERTRLSAAECGYVSLTEGEKATIKRVLMRAVEDQQARLTSVLEHAVEA